MSADAVTRRILVVEDEFLIRMTLTEALSDEGFDVLEAESGDTALALLQSESGICLLLTDIQLPGTLNGKELATKAREQAPDLPVIFMTGRPDPSDAPAEGVVYISKPYSLNDVCQAAQRLTQ